jgi:hypothetical protein
LHISQDELPPLGRVLFGLHVLRHMLQAEPMRQRLVPLLGRCKIAKQLSCRGVRRALGRLFVEELGLPLHPFGLSAHLVDAERPHQPVGPALVIASHMLAADQRYALTKPLPMQFDQRRTVTVLFVRHAVEDCSRGGEGVAQTVRIGPVETAVILLGRDGECEDFLLGQRIEGTAAKAEDAGKHDEDTLV